jgi:hypothetical protein
MLPLAILGTAVAVSLAIKAVKSVLEVKTAAAELVEVTADAAVSASIIGVIAEAYCGAAFLPVAILSFKVLMAIYLVGWMLMCGLIIAIFSSVSRV